MKIFYKKYDLSEYLGEEISIETLIIARLERYGDKPVLKDRSVIVVPIKYYSIEIDSLEKRNLLYNPIPLIPAIDFDEGNFPIRIIEEVKDINISILETWAFKKYAWITPLVEIPFHMPWEISLDYCRKLHNWNYDEDRCKHLEFSNIVPYSAVKLKLAFEYLRSKDLEIKNNVINFDKHFNNDSMTRILYHHTLSTTPFHKVPDDMKGRFDVKDEELEKVSDYSKYL